MKNLAIVGFAILFTTATVGQQSRANGDGQGAGGQRYWPTCGV